MSKQLALPFAIDALGRVAFVEDPYRQTAQRLELLIGTALRSRAMRPDFGVDTYAYIFSVMDEGTIDRLTTEITSAVAAWEPGAVINEVIPTTEDTALSLTVYFSLVGIEDDQGVGTATVQIGVSERG